MSLLDLQKAIGANLYMQPLCYSQRTLNPFRGVMNIIELDNADAVTTDCITWAQDSIDQLISDYLEWQAPWLLLLSNLSREQRTELEVVARQRAIEMASQYRLYPEMIDASQLTAARVEAQLRAAQSEKTENESSPLAVFYIEE